jgi:hypothetical protein
MTEHQPIVEELIVLLNARPGLAKALAESIRKADRPKVATLQEYFRFQDSTVTLIPTDRNLNPAVLDP